MVDVFGSLVFKNKTLFIALWVTKNWQKLGINGFLVFKNMTKTGSKNWSVKARFLKPGKLKTRGIKQDLSRLHACTHA